MIITREIMAANDPLSPCAWCVHCTPEDYPFYCDLCPGVLCGDKGFFCIHEEPDRTGLLMLVIAFFDDFGIAGFPVSYLNLSTIISEMQGMKRKPCLGAEIYYFDCFFTI